MPPHTLLLRPRLLFTTLAALALGACSPPQAKDPQADASAAIAKQVMLPTYTRWAEADKQLAISALAFCAGKADLATARADLLHAQRAWAALQPLLIGPLAEGNRAWSVQFWPDKKNLVGRQVEALISAGQPIDAQSLASGSVVVQGLSAYEYILFDSKPELADASRKASYCPLLIAIGERQQQLADEIVTRWTAADGVLAQMSTFPNQRYADSHEAIAEVLRVQVTALDTLKKKLGTPMGRQSKGIAQPYQAEAWRSQSSLKSLQASLLAAQSVWLGVEGNGLRSLVPAAQKPLAQSIDGAYAAALQALESNDRSLTALLEDPAARPQLDTLYARLDAVHRLHQNELAKALNIQLGFNANDGD